MKNLQPTMSADTTKIDPSTLLQLLEAGRHSGTVRAGALWLRLADGVVVKGGRDGERDGPHPIQTALQVVRELVAFRGELSFRAVSGKPQGPITASLTGILLQVATARDEAGRS